MRVRLVAGLLLALLVRGSYAADSAMPVKTPPTAATAYDWTGFYIGAHIGVTAGSSNWTGTFPGSAAPPVTGSIDFFHSYDAFTGSGTGR